MTPTVIITNCGRYFEGGQLTNKQGAEVPVQKFQESPNKGDFGMILIGDHAYGPFFVNSVSQIGNDKIYNVTIFKICSL